MDELDQMIKILAETHSKNPEKFINMLEKTFEKVPSDEKGNLFLGVGHRLYDFSYLTLAAATWNKAREYFVNDKDRAGEANCYGNLGNAYDSLGDFRKAIEYSEKGLDIAREIGARADEAKCYIYLGFACNSLGDSRKAIEYYEKALKINKELGAGAGESACYTGLGVAYDIFRRFQESD